MDIAIVVSGHRQGGDASDLMLRPFADSSLIELAMERLQRLDAPCARYVACQDREVRDLAASFPGLKTLRASHLAGWAGLDGDPSQFAHLRGLREDWLLVVNPAFPLVHEDTWWQVIEDFLATTPRGIRSAHVVDGPFFGHDGKPVFSASSVFAANDAFLLLPRRERDIRNLIDSGEAAPWVLSADAALSVNDTAAMTALEARLSIARLGVSV